LFRVKICGFTRAQDVRAAVAAGADALGFQMTMGPRRVKPLRARRLARLLPPWVTPVGVFVDEPIARVLRLIDFCGFQAVQLHGGEDAAYAKRMPVPVIKVVRVKNTVGEAPFRGYSVAAFLLDRYNRRLRGGTGEPFPWRLARRAAHLPAPFLLAGGLHPGNVARAVREARPFGVDVASGVETSPGVKDARRMAEFVRRAKAALRRLRG
jgi:phosphoribosylanthranilate isomerase